MAFAEATLRTRKTMISEPRRDIEGADGPGSLLALALLALIVGAAPDSSERFSGLHSNTPMFGATR